MKTKLKKTYNYLIRIIIVVATYTFLYFQIFQKRNLSEFYDNFIELINKPDFIYGIVLVFILMFVNWGLETWKWKLLISKIERVKFFRAYEAVLTGISVSAFLPNRIGDYFGRVFILKRANHIEGILVTIVGSISQLITTLILGSVALLIFLPQHVKESMYFNDYVFSGLIAFIAIAIFFLLLFYFNISILSNFLLRFTRKNWTNLRHHLQAFSYFNPKELLKILLLSTLRYFVFTLQFHLLLVLFGIQIPLFDSIILITVFFFILTAIPTIALAEIGVRGSVSLFVFGLYFSTMGYGTGWFEMGVFSASSALWLINIVIPAIAGTIFVFNLKFFRKNHS